MDGGFYYGNFIRDFDTRCQKSIVRIRTHGEGNKKDLIRTGVVIASTDRSCCIITSNIAKHYNEVEFFDGTKAVANKNYVKIRKEVGMAIIPIIGLDRVHWEVANLSQNEAVLGQMIFTLGYNSDNAESFNQTKEDGITVTGNFISGSVVSRAGIQNDKFENAITFVHACATGPNGHMGSAVFSETEMLLGVNVSYTTTRGVDYTSDKPDGGLVSALDLQTMKRGFELMYRLKNMSLPEIVQFLRNMIGRVEARGHA